LKKIVAAITSTLFIVGAGVTTASAQEHEVQRGENLWDLANEYNTTVDEIMEINELETAVLQPKQLIYISQIYEVQKGDTLISIGNEHDVTADDLKEWNELESSLIVVGQELKINSADAVEEVQEESTNESAEREPSEEKEQVSAAPAEPVESEQEPQGETFSVTATAYTAGCEGCSGVTYTGVDLNKDPNAKVIAVDPSVIPLGSEVYVEGYGRAIAADIGGAINGNKIDVHVPTKDEAYAWGVRTVNVTVIK
jgi:3D (Asp-Asp-Asp) domain-containing protein